MGNSIGLRIKGLKRSIDKVCYSLRNNGFNETKRKIKRYLNRKRMVNIGSKCYFNVNDGENVIQLANIVVPNDFVPGKIAIHIHLYYIDLSKEFISFLSNMPYTFDLFISVRTGVDCEQVKRNFSSLENVGIIKVKQTPNKGRDIAPFYSLFGDELSKYDCIMHAHSKKSLYTGVEQSEWRTTSLKALLGDIELIKKIIYLLSEKKIGLFFPETSSQMPVFVHDWLKNADLGHDLLSSMGIRFDDGFFNYPVGSFFWGNGNSLKKLFDLNLKYDDFDDEKGQNDGTLAHALERAISFVVRDAGYHLGIYDIKEKRVSIDKSIIFYKDYLGIDKNALLEYLEGYNTISFDVFDTIITRKCLLPDTVFMLVGKRICDVYGISVDFLKIRKEAEQIATEKYGKNTDIYAIYNQVSYVDTRIKKEWVSDICKMEIEIETDMCIPRKEMLDLINALIEKNKRIIFVTDMYLPSEVISSILLKCGYRGYDSLWVSCEKGCRKDDGSIWEEYKRHFGTNTIHIGDNTHSDMQEASDCGIETFYIMSPLTELKISNGYEYILNDITSDIENSMLLGVIINEYLFNSPFRLTPQGDIKELELSDEAAIGCGALFFRFISWLYDRQSDAEEYWFLSREGYYFSEIYELLCKKKNNYKKFIYFLSSRRASSVASIVTIEDVKNILSQNYSGYMTSLFISRLGIDIDKKYEMYISLPNDIAKTESIVKEYWGQIFLKAQSEKMAYLSYIENVCEHKLTPVVVDVGYSGTIQYYLSKLMGRALSGRYLCTNTIRKPLLVNGQMEALDDNKSEDDLANSIIFRYHLFFESILQAPFGQLIGFKKNEKDEVFPCYKEGSNVISDNIMNYRNGITKFINEIADLENSYHLHICNDSTIAIHMFDMYMSNGWVSKCLRKSLDVEDDYCSDRIKKVFE